MEKLSEQLVQRMLGIVRLKVTPEQVDAAEQLFTRYTSELEEILNKDRTEEAIMRAFKPFVNNILSVVETMIDKEKNQTTYRGCRRLILNEIYGYQATLLGKGGG